jgi:hypothetical protein
MNTQLVTHENCASSWMKNDQNYTCNIYFYLMYLSVAECLRSLTCTSLLWVRIPTGTLDSFIWESYPLSYSLRNVGCATQVLVRAWINALKGAWGLSHSVSWKVAMWSILFWCEVKLNQKKWYGTKLFFSLRHDKNISINR